MIYVRDLPETSHPTRPNADGSITLLQPIYLHCPTCDATFSATRGDYFWMPATKPFRCQHCRAALQLVTEHTIYRKGGRA